MTDKEKLQQFTKGEIIDAILKIKRWHSFLSVDHIVDEIKSVSFNNAFEKAQEARNHAIECMQKYFNWRKEIVQRYGDGTSVKLKNIPLHELKKGAELEKKWKDSEEARKKAEKEEDRYYKRGTGR